MSGNEADIHIFFGELKEYPEKYKISYWNELLANNTFDNWSDQKYNNKYQLISTSYFIDTSRTNSTVRGIYNIKRLFLKSMGLLGSIDSKGSLFDYSPNEPVTRFYREDKRLIKLFYSDSIKAGMNLSEVNKALETLDLESLYKAKL